MLIFLWNIDECLEGITFKSITAQSLHEFAAIC